MKELLEVPGIALLVVSDNSATGAALVGRTVSLRTKFKNLSGRRNEIES